MLDLSERSGRDVGEAVWGGEFEGCCRNACYCDQDSQDRKRLHCSIRICCAVEEQADVKVMVRLKESGLEGN